jgi:hypothetical protein
VWLCPFILTSISLPHFFNQASTIATKFIMPAMTSQSHKSLVMLFGLIVYLSSLSVAHGMSITRSPVDKAYMVSAGYANVDFVNPAYILSHNGSADTAAAQQAIINAANQAASSGPLSEPNHPFPLHPRTYPSPSFLSSPALVVQHHDCVLADRPI